MSNNNKLVRQEADIVYGKLPGLNWSVTRTNWSDKRLTSFMCNLPGLNWSVTRTNWSDKRLTSFMCNLPVVNAQKFQN